MKLTFQQFIKLKGYVIAIAYRRLIPILFMILLLVLFLTFRSGQYLSHNFVTTIHKSTNATINSTVQTRTKSELNKVVVVSHYNEDLDWLALFVGEQIPHIVYTRSKDPLARHRIAINKGREAVTYLRYIVDHYSNLPSSIAFIHGHRRAWHQQDPSDMVIALRALQWNKYNYMPLTSVMTAAIFKLNTGDPQATVNYELWRDVLQKELGPPPKNGIRAPCCASFVVKREVILAHPKSFYSNVSDYIVASPRSDQLTSTTLEYTWHMIFGQPAYVKYTRCDIYICDSKGNISVKLAERIKNNYWT